MAAKNENSVPDAEHRPLLLPVLRTALVMCSSIFLESTYFSIAVRTPLDPFFLGFLAVQAISTLFSSDPLQSLMLSKRVLLVGLVYFFASTVVREQQAKRLVAVLLGTATIVATIGVTTLLLRSRLDDKSSTNFGRS